MVGMVHSSYYRQPSLGKKGNNPSELTYHSKKGLVAQDTVIDSVKSILSHPFIDCGYRLMTSYLTREGYTINHKKLYRIMKQANLLKSEYRIDTSGSGRKFVKSSRCAERCDFYIFYIHSSTDFLSNNVPYVNTFYGSHQFYPAPP